MRLVVGWWIAMLTLYSRLVRLFQNESGAGEIPQMSETDADARWLRQKVRDVGLRLNAYTPARAQDLGEAAALLREWDQRFPAGAPLTPDVPSWLEFFTRAAVRNWESWDQPRQKRVPRGRLGIYFGVRDKFVDEYALRPLGDVLCALGMTDEAVVATAHVAADEGSLITVQCDGQYRTRKTHIRAGMGVDRPDSLRAYDEYDWDNVPDV